MSPTRPLPETTRLARGRYRRRTDVVGLMFTSVLVLSTAGLLYLWDFFGQPRVQLRSAAEWGCASAASISVNGLFGWRIIRGYAYWRWPCPVCGTRTGWRYPPGYEGNFLLACGHCETLWDSGERFTPAESSPPDRCP